MTRGGDPTAGHPASSSPEPNPPKVAAGVGKITHRQRIGQAERRADQCPETQKQQKDPDRPSQQGPKREAPGSPSRPQMRVPGIFPSPSDGRPTAQRREGPPTTPAPRSRRSIPAPDLKSPGRQDEPPVTARTNPGRAKTSAIMAARFHGLRVFIGISVTSYSPDRSTSSFFSAPSSEGSGSAGAACGGRLAWCSDRRSPVRPARPRSSVSGGARRGCPGL